MTPKKPSLEILNYLDEFFDYDPVTGQLWKYSKKYMEWFECQSIHDSGRYRVKIRYRTYFVTNICWYLHYGVWPIAEIDHEDLNGYNNKIINLRISGFSENSRNADKRNKNKYIGVSYHSIGCKWRYRFSINEKRYEVYGFNTSKDAAIARERHLDQLGDTFCARNKNLG